MSVMLTYWTPDEIAILKALWAEDVSDACIAKRIGRSKNAVISKRRREGIGPRRGKPSAPRSLSR